MIDVGGDSGLEAGTGFEQLGNAVNKTNDNPASRPMQFKTRERAWIALLIGPVLIVGIQRPILAVYKGVEL